MKKKLTSAEYQALPIQLKDRYTRYSGSDEVYYELIRTPLPEAQPLEGVKTVEEILDAAVEFGKLDIKDNDYSNIVDAMEVYHQSRATTKILSLFLDCVNNSEDEGHFFQKMQDSDLIKLAEKAVNKSK